MHVNLELLSEEIAKRNLSFTKMAEHCGVDKATISRLFNGRVCTIETAQKIVKGLKLSSRKASLIFFPD